jgi:hypothetical protein
MQSTIKLRDAALTFGEKRIRAKRRNKRLLIGGVFALTTFGSVFLGLKYAPDLMRIYSERSDKAKAKKEAPTFPPVHYTPIQNKPTSEKGLDLIPSPHSNSLLL